MHVQILNQLNTITILASAVVIALVVFCWYAIKEEEFEIIENVTFSDGSNTVNKIKDIKLRRYQKWLNDDAIPKDVDGIYYTMKPKTESKGGKKSPYRRRRR